VGAGADAGWRDRIRDAPLAPGVYRMRDAAGAVLYVGKALSLRARLRSYLDPEGQGPKTVLLMRQVAQVEWFVTDNELSALILENSLIKEGKPRYNIRLRDDKTYPFLRLSVQEEYPVLTVVRRPAADGAKYFGPYVPASALRATLRLLRRLFPLRLCRRLRPGKPCLNHQMGRCPAPCAGGIDPREYRERVRGVQLFLQGRGADLVASLKREMAAAAQELRFEEAAVLRDRLGAVEATLVRQSVHDPAGGDCDVAGLVRLGERVGVALLHVREGRLIGTESFSIREPLEEGGGAVLAGFLQACYAEGREVPPEVLLPSEPAGRETLEAWLAGIRGERVRLRVPLAGEKKRLLLMASRDAMRILQDEKAGAAGGDVLLEELGRVAGAGEGLGSLACMDVSNISGTDAVASLVWWEGGAPRRQRYRRFRIRRSGPPDDYGMLAEAVGRLAARVAAGSWQAPDVLLLDGGRGHLAAGAAALDAGAWRPRLLLAIAKPSERRGTDAVFARGRAAALPFAPDAPVLRLLQRTRDEAHRFAIAYHRLLRSRRLRGGVLEGVPGLGPARRKALLLRFGGLAGVRAATREELAGTVPAAVAAALYASLHPDEPVPGVLHR
jgi:excinuclease ABC subunit C